MIARPCFGGDHRLFAAIENLNAQFFFQFVYLHAERGLRNETVAGGRSKMPVGVNGNDIFQLNEGHPNID